ncbi:hypothetical protein ACFV2A_11805 [Streptomyces californicus]|uniref:hypothetical protein n=1 Tax=Streptomyces californicus TaxID=67351 RepID=UPI003697946A
MTMFALEVPRGSEAADELFVLHGQVLRPGAALALTSRFADPVWVLTPALHQRHGRSLSLNFATIPSVYRPVVKELCYGLLSGPLPPGEDRPTPVSIYSKFTAVRAFLRWLAKTKSGKAIASLTAADLEDFLRHLTKRQATVDQRVRAKSAVRYFWRWRQSLTETGRLAFDPAHIDGWGEANAQGRRENATSRIPEEVMGPLLGWSLRFIDTFADDILAADREWWQRRRRPTALGTGPSPKNLSWRLQSILDEHVAAGRPLPGFKGTFSFYELAEMLNCHAASLYRYRAQIEAAFAKVGAEEFITFQAPVTAILDGKPWIGAVVRHQDHPGSIATLARMLQTACYVVIAYLSGMRDGEIKHLRRGSLSVETDADGAPYRWRLASLAFKGSDDPIGVPAVWLAGAPVARAIGVLEALHRDTDMLFATLPHIGKRRAERLAVEGVMTSSTTNTNLNQLVTWINDYCREHGRTDRVPDVDGRPWRLMSSQFRRTLAWFIARRPGGTIAGALQYRHQSIQMFEGYAGTSDSGFRAEVESEQALARGEHLLAMVDAHEHHQMEGPAAVEATRRLDALGQRASFTGQVVLDPARLKRIMRKHDPAVYPGKFITCVHDPAKALCEKARTTAAEGLPEHGGCQPLGCQNVALTSVNRDQWQAELDAITNRLRAPLPPPPLLETRLRQRRDEITQFLDRTAGEAQ